MLKASLLAAAAEAAHEAVWQLSLRDSTVSILRIREGYEINALRCRGYLNHYSTV